MPITVKIKLPKKFSLDPGRIETELNMALTEVAETAKELFDGSASTFDDKPDFEITRPGGQWTRKISTDNANYFRLNEGTKAHLISPAPGGVLKIPTWNSPKTKLGQLQAMTGGQSNEFIFTKLPVLNPGFKGRQFDRIVAAKIKPIFKKRVIAAIKSGFKG